MNLPRNKAITLIELLIALVLLGVMTLAFSSIDLFSRHHLRTSERRVKIHNELSYVLETIAKDVVRASGDAANAGIKSVSSTSFTVRVDNNLNKYGAPTSEYGDDDTITYALSGNQVTRKVNAGSAVSMNTQDIIPSGGFQYTILASLDGGSTGSGIEVRMTGRYDPSLAVSVDNPESKIKTQVYSQAMGAN